MTGEVGKAGEKGVRGLDHPLVVELLLGGGADSVVVGDEVGEDLDQLAKDILGHVRHNDYMCMFCGDLYEYVCECKCVWKKKRKGRTKRLCRVEYKDVRVKKKCKEI